MKSKFISLHQTTDTTCQSLIFLSFSQIKRFFAFHCRQLRMERIIYGSVMPDPFGKYLKGRSTPTRSLDLHATRTVASTAKYFLPRANSSRAVLRYQDVVRVARVENRAEGLYNYIPIRCGRRDTRRSLGYPISLPASCLFLLPCLTLL